MQGIRTSPVLLGSKHGGQGIFGVQPTWHSNLAALGADERAAGVSEHAGTAQAGSQTVADVQTTGWRKKSEA